MKKSLVFALIMVLAMAGLASADVKIGGDLKAEYVIDTDKNGPAGTGTASAPLKLALSAVEEGVWSVKADLKANAAKSNEVAVDKWSMNLTDDLFVADIWGGGVELTEVKTPMEFVKAKKAPEEDVAKFRVKSDVAGYVDLTLDYDPSEFFTFFASKKLDSVTVGGAVQKNLVKEGLLGVGHVVYTTGPLTLTGEAGIDTATDKDNLLLGGKVGYKLTDRMNLGGKVTHKAKNITDGGEFLVEPSITYTEDLFKATAAYTWKDDIDNSATKATNKVKANVTYRSNDDVVYDDLFDEYDTLTGYAAFAEGAYTTAKKDGNDEEPLMELTLKGAGAVVPGMVWVKGELQYKADEDGTAKDEDVEFIKGNNSRYDEVDVLAEKFFRVVAESTIQITEKLKAVPAVAYVAWTNVDEVKLDTRPASKDASYLDLTAALTYALSARSEVGISYTDRSEKWGDTDEYKDGFAKVWFKTTF